MISCDPFRRLNPPVLFAHYQAALLRLRCCNLMHLLVGRAPAITEGWIVVMLALTVRVEMAVMVMVMETSASMASSVKAMGIDIVA